MSRALRAAIVAALLGAGAACNQGPPPSAPVQHESGPRWQDVFDGTPDIYAVIRPQAIKRDALYGAFWKSLVRTAQARSFVGGATTLEAAEGSEEIIVGINRRADAALVLRGVPASLDPEKLTANGHPLFRLVDERAKVHEYQLLDRRNADPGSVFVLEDRVWVGAIGEARTRARQAFASPLNRPAPKVEADALAVVRLGTPVVQGLFAKHPVFGLLTKKLSAASFTLKPGKAGLVVGLLYDDQDGAAWAEMQAKRIVSELSHDEKRFGWLKDTKVHYEGNTLQVVLALPPRLLEELPNATGADLAF